MKAKHIDWLIVACITTIVGIISVSVINDVFGTYETVGEPYVESFTYCGAYTGAGGQNHCTMWLTGHETRINTKIHGYFFETTGYRVVR